MTTAGLLRGEGFFLDCLQDRSRAKRLLDVCTELFITWTRAAWQATGVSAEAIGICDDYAGLLGPDLWSELVLPYYRRIAEALAPKGIWIHTEQVRRRHLSLLRELRPLFLNFGENQFLTIAEALTELPDIPFGWHLKTVSEMLQGTPQSIRARLQEIVQSGIEEVICELAVGTPAKNVRAHVEVATEMAGG